MATRSRNHGTNDTSLTPRIEEDRKALVETIWKIVRKKKLTAHEIVIKEMINANIKNTNDHSRPQKI